MKRNALSRLLNLRFRRWTRKAYAVFATLKSAVSIGTITIPMVKISFDKSISLLLDKWSFDTLTDEKEKTEALLEEQLEYSCILLATKNDAAARYFTNIHTKKTIIGLAPIIVFF